MHGVTESMAGRAAVLRMLPLSTVETAKVTLLRGGYPEILARPRDSDLWFQSYLRTYLERDVRQVSQIRELANLFSFHRILRISASASSSRPRYISQTQAWHAICLASTAPVR